MNDLYKKLFVISFCVLLLISSMTPEVESKKIKKLFKKKFVKKFVKASLLSKAMGKKTKIIVPLIIPFKMQ